MLTVNKLRELRYVLNSPPEFLVHTKTISTFRTDEEDFRPNVDDPVGVRM
jgi:hypothetical protein